MAEPATDDIEHIRGQLLKAWQPPQDFAAIYRSYALLLLTSLDAEIAARQAAERRVEELERELRDTQTAFKAVCGVPED